MPARTPSAVHELFLDAFNRGDVESVVALYEAGAVLRTRQGVSIGRDAIREAYRKILMDGAQMRLETDTVIECNDGLALLHAKWTYQRADDAVSGKSTEVLRRQSDGSWLFVIDEPNTISS
jgi:uncharacterized protein (TIGR02246 family)